ncbi:MAG: ArsA-related P-loop ATPase, partial [Myxococcota bacterium]
MNAAERYQASLGESTPESAAAVSALDEVLTSRPLVLVTGKGGVGKSSVAAALALRAANLGLRPLLFECDAPPRPSLFPGGIRSDDEIREVIPGVLAVNQSSDAAIKAYAHHAIPSKTVAELLLDNRVARLFLHASPSVTEMALLGRIVQLAEDRSHDGPVIVDLHSTGHALHVLQAPMGIMRVLRKGPVYDRAKVTGDFVFNPHLTAVVTVALPEELPVTELLEVIESLHRIGAPLGPVVLNALLRDPLTAVSDDTIDRVLAAMPQWTEACRRAHALRAWAARGAREEHRLREGLVQRGLRAHILSLPFVIDVASSDETIATRLDSAIEHEAHRCP